METIKSLKVANGLVEGQVKNVLGGDIVQFLSIPYCKAPVGKLRFQRPQPCETFSDEVINKLNFETCPPQMISKMFNDESLLVSKWTPRGVQNEDCLYVNVWCPLDILKGNEKHAVLIFIHGGAFVIGSSSLGDYDGSILASHENIIVVSFNYRLGILGFLCLDDHIKGNLGIWDQVAALKWIYQNISVFNGDRENMTLVGNSAGGVSVSLHLLIEDSWPHFSKAIIQSGVCLSTWAILSKDELNRRSILCINKILTKHEFPLKWNSSLSEEDKQSIMDFLQSLEFNEYLIETDVFRSIAQLSWTPCVDGELIKDNPKSLFKNRKFKICPIIFLNVANEGYFLILKTYPNIIYDNPQKISIKYLDEALKYYPHFPILFEAANIIRVKREYNIQGDTMCLETFDKIVSDKNFISDSIELANIVSKYNKDIYYLWFNTSSPSIWPICFGVMHTDEVYHLFGNTMKLESGTSESEKETSRLLMRQYTHFIKSGRLLNDVRHYDEIGRKHASLDSEGWVSKTFSDDLINKAAFWNNFEDT